MTLMQEATMLIQKQPESNLKILVDVMRAMIKPVDRGDIDEYNHADVSVNDFADDVIMPAKGGIKLGLANGKYPSIDDFAKDDEEIAVLFGGSE